MSSAEHWSTKVSRNAGSEGSSTGRLRRLTATGGDGPGEEEGGSCDGHQDTTGR